MINDWTVATLSPNDKADVFDYNEFTYILYFAAHHDTVTDAADSMTNLADRLGYTTSADRKRQAEVVQMS